MAPFSKGAIERLVMAVNAAGRDFRFHPKDQWTANEESIDLLLKALLPWMSEPKYRARLGCSECDAYLVAMDPKEYDRREQAKELAERWLKGEAASFEMTALAEYFVSQNCSHKNRIQSIDGGPVQCSDCHTELPKVGPVQETKQKTSRTPDIVSDLRRFSRNLTSKVQRETSVTPSLLRAAADLIEKLSKR